jgi:MFS family permease
VPVRPDKPNSLFVADDVSAREAVTQRAFFVSHIVREPFVVLYSMLAVLMAKQLDATPFQVAVLTMLKPLVSVISFYWGSFLLSQRSHLKAHLLAASTLAIFPFLLAPVVNHAWFYVAAGATYALFSKAAIPARMELFRINTREGGKETLFSKASCLSYATSVIASVIFGIILDAHPELWRPLLCTAAAICSLSGIALAYVPDGDAHKQGASQSIGTNVKEVLLHPWRASFQLLRDRPDFLRFQISFFLAGLGLMIAMPAIPGFLTNLDISYIELFLSIGVLKGLGFIATSPLWAIAIRRFPLAYVSGAVFSCFGCFCACLLLAVMNPLFIFAAYAVYGVAQAGSDLVWNLSGPIFSGQGVSVQYSSVNILAIGLRGLIGPPLGGILAQFVSPEVAIATGLGIGCLAVWYTVSAYRHTQAPAPVSLTR